MSGKGKVDVDPIIQDFVAFLNASPTAWHAVESVEQRLLQSGFEILREEDSWTLKPGGRYLVTRNGSSLCAFCLPTSSPKGVRILASHTDSPGLKLKPNPEFRKQEMVLFGVEVYGSPLLNSWLNRDLGLAGKVAYLDGKGQLQETLVRLDKHPLIIPQLAIHLDRDVNEKGLVLNKQDHLSALAAIGKQKEDRYLEKLLQEQIAYQELLGFELFLYPLDPARLVGFRNQMISSYRLDNLGGVHAASTAFIQELKPSKDLIKMIVFWDNEEVGSSTAQGAESPFLPETIERVMIALNKTREDYFRLLRQSLCLSVDLVHAAHPNYMEKHDAQHQPIMGEGAVMKVSAQQRYVSDSRLLALVNLIAKKAKISLQTYVNRNDIKGGTTIGPIQSALTGIPTIDIGYGQLSMHSSREMAACSDHLAMVKLLTTFLAYP